MFPCRDYQCSGLRMISNTAHRTSRFKEKIKIQISCKILHVIVSNFRHLHTQWKLLFCQILNSIIWNFKNKYGGIKDLNNSQVLLFSINLKFTFTIGYRYNTVNQLLFVCKKISQGSQERCRCKFSSSWTSN